MNSPVVIGVAGGTGSGKTTVVEAIVKSLGYSGVAVIEQDSYYRDIGEKSKSERDAHNYDHPGAIETELLIEHIKALREGGEVDLPIYDYKTQCRSKEVRTLVAAGIIIIEGHLLYADKGLMELMDVKIFVDTDDDIRFIRRLRRDIEQRGHTMESVIDQYLQTVKPMHIKFVEPSRKFADIIIPEGHNPVAVDMVVTMIKSTLDDGAQ